MTTRTRMYTHCQSGSSSNNVCSLARQIANYITPPLWLILTSADTLIVGEEATSSWNSWNLSTNSHVPALAAVHDKLHVPGLAAVTVCVTASAWFFAECRQWLCKVAAAKLILRHCGRIRHWHLRDVCFLRPVCISVHLLRDVCVQNYEVVPWRLFWISVKTWKTLFNSNDLATCHYRPHFVFPDVFCIEWCTAICDHLYNTTTSHDLCGTGPNLTCQ